MLRHIILIGLVSIALTGCAIKNTNATLPNPSSLMKEFPSYNSTKEQSKSFLPPKLTGTITLVQALSVTLMNHPKLEFELEILLALAILKG